MTCLITQKLCGRAEGENLGILDLENLGFLTPKGVLSQVCDSLHQKSHSWGWRVGGGE